MTEANEPAARSAGDVFDSADRIPFLAMLDAASGPAVPVKMGEIESSEPT